MWKNAYTKTDTWKTEEREREKEGEGREENKNKREISTDKCQQKM